MSDKKLKKEVYEIADEIKREDIDLPDKYTDTDFQFYSDEHVNKLQEYIENNFSLDGAARHLVNNILKYVASQGEDGETTLNMLGALLDSLGISREEIVEAVTESWENYL